MQCQLKYAYLYHLPVRYLLSLLDIQVDKVIIVRIAMVVRIVLIRSRSYPRYKQVDSESMDASTHHVRPYNCIHHFDVS